MAWGLLRLNGEYMGSLPLLDALSNNKEKKKQITNTAEQ